MPRRILGIDGGGTRTRAVIVDDTGRLLGIGLGGPANYDDIGIDATRENLSRAILAARQDAGLEAQAFDAAFFGLAGVVSENDHRIVRQIIADLQVAQEAQIGIDHDCRIALAGALSGRAGIVLITGTGSACYGRTADGKAWRAGGWGELLADEGSGGWLGLQALRMAVRAFDGREQPTRLVDDILTHFELQQMNDIMHRIYHVGLSRKERAALAPLVMRAARDNDEVAQRLIDEGVAELAQCVQAVAHRLQIQDRFDLAIVGGLYSVEDVFAAPLRAAIRTKAPGCRIQPAELSPVLGACILALQQIQVEPATVSAALTITETTLAGALAER